MQLQFLPLHPHEATVQPQAIVAKVRVARNFKLWIRHEMKQNCVTKTLHVMSENWLCERVPLLLNVNVAHNKIYGQQEVRVCEELSNGDK